MSTEDFTYVAIESRYIDSWLRAGHQIRQVGLKREVELARILLEQPFQIGAGGYLNGLVLGRSHASIIGAPTGTSHIL